MGMPAGVVVSEEMQLAQHPVQLHMLLLLLGCSLGSGCCLSGAPRLPRGSYKMGMGVGLTAPNMELLA